MDKISNTVPEVKNSQEPDMRLHIDNLTWLLDSANTTFNEGRLTVSDGRIWVDSVEPNTSVSTIARYEPDIDAGEYVNGEYQVGVDYGDFLDVLSSAKAYANDNGGMVDVKVDIGRFEVEAGAFSYKLAGIDPSVLRRPYELKKFRNGIDNVYQMHTDALSGALKAAGLSGTHITFEATQSNMILRESADDDESAVSLSYADRGKVTSTTTEVGGKPPQTTLVSKYGIEYFTWINKAISDSFELSLDDDFPCLVDIEEMDGRGTICFLLAPIQSR